jgi:hypothetical protein
MRIIIRIIALLPILTLLSDVGIAQSSTPVERLGQLEKRLDQIMADDKPIVLTLGSDFLQAPGTVIFLSRKAGIAILIALARSDEPELAMLYLPEWEVWITQTRVRNKADLRIDGRYVQAAMVAGLKVEYWHTHNSFTPDILTAEERYQRSIQWTMPSPVDLRQFYDLSRDIPGARMLWFIASTHGITTYWNDDKEWATPIYVRSAVQNEADQLYNKTGKLALKDLPQFAASHKGFVSLKFELVTEISASKQPN